MRVPRMVLLEAVVSILRTGGGLQNSKSRGCERVGYRVGNISWSRVRGMRGWRGGGRCTSRRDLLAKRIDDIRCRHHFCSSEDIVPSSGDDASVSTDVALLRLGGIRATIIITGAYVI